MLANHLTLVMVTTNDIIIADFVLGTEAVVVTEPVVFIELLV